MLLNAQTLNEHARQYGSKPFFNAVMPPGCLSRRSLRKWRWRLRMKTRELRMALKRLKWIPSSWQKPEAISSQRRPNPKLSICSLRSPANAETLFLSVLPAEIRLRIYEYFLSDPPVWGISGHAPSPAYALEYVRHYPINAMWRVPGRLRASTPSVYNPVS